jgi:hypothetical protein
MKINTRQKRVLLASASIVGLMALFPPWISTSKYSSYRQSLDREHPAGYSFIGTPPPAEGSSGIKFDLARLSFQLLGVSALTSVAFFSLSDGKEN